MLTITLKKQDGTEEKFSPTKLEQSLVRSGAKKEVADQIVNDIIEDIQKNSGQSAQSKEKNKEGELATEKTEEEASGTYDVTSIYTKAFHMLREESMAAAARYSLRRSIMEFGPTGFPFEDYIAEVFKAQGYQTLTDQTVLGGCVPHEVDVVAWNDSKLLMAEVKFHNESTGKTDLKVALYVRARFDDLRNNLYVYGGHPGRKIDEWILITNTKFTATAETYAICKGLSLLSWSYPEKGNLLDIIEKTKLHPITCLVSLTNAEKKTLLEKKVVLCRSIYENRELIDGLGFSEEKIFSIIEEISQIINLTPKE